MIKIILIVLACFYVALNILVSKLETAKEMKKHYIENQCVVGMVFANLFYAPAWIFKAIRFLVCAIVA